ncbi:transposable element tc3 transposase [Lasius niger]|uniref:Transposable element tc3 transposase n=1 Tax=Lasius niger TaxID=67767 RepID=A0A0J7K1X0_LASNI|nr:transposable element tc3 transposase [Lasius niger]
MGKLKDEVGSLCAFISGAFRKGAIRISNSFPSFIGGCVKKARLEVDSVTVGDPGQSERLSSKKKFWLTLKQTQKRAPALSVIRWIRTTCLSGRYCTNNSCTHIICRRQALSPADFPRRVAFAELFLERCAVDPQFPATVLFSDEACFTREGTFNSKNSHVWAEDNPHRIFESRHQEKFGINIWMGIIGDHLIGPNMLPTRLNGLIYVRFLEEVLPGLLEEVPLALRQVMWFQDGAPAHCSIATHNHLQQVFGERWIGRTGPVEWPPRSPDLTPLDFFLWGHLKSLVYDIPIESEEDLITRIMAACEVTQAMPNILAQSLSYLLDIARGTPAEYRMEG